MIGIILIPIVFFLFVAAQSESEDLKLPYVYAIKKWKGRRSYKSIGLPVEVGSGRITDYSIIDLREFCRENNIEVNN